MGFLFAEVQKVEISPPLSNQKMPRMSVTLMTRTYSDAAIAEQMCAKRFRVREKSTYLP